MSAIKVLLAEDHVITRQGVCRLLQKEHDLSVIGEAGDGEEAVRMATEMQPDVVIMDIAMPKLNGIEATRQIKLLRPTIAVLVLSAYDDDEYVFGLLEAGTAGYLLKTASGDDLIHAIRAVYRGEPVLDPVVLRKVMNRFRSPDQGPGGGRPFEHLSEREIDVIKLAAKGMSNKEIAEELMLSRRTVEGHLRSIFNKLGVGSRTEAVLDGLRKGWFALEDIA
ncbi:MAG: response regulator transcription factor [Chloroflexi bacterium]|jgi:DNA-binding NarL/FixJ family response regulator|nr:response regulator transcription factor [Chloroflexota bacterium]